MELLNVFDPKNYDIASCYASRLPGEEAPANDIHFQLAEPFTVRVNFGRRF